ncbi:hypothetical protein V5799_005358 [Amblyomma americanum]|uniref:Uncharacterized protein n=1 Tax=Amblyomma americanum TaxID=6943 RepID=A0AAQ4DZG5_AMBAM
MEVAEPAVGEPADVNPKHDLSEEEEWDEDEEGEEGDGLQVDAVNEMRGGRAPKPFRYQIFQVIGTLVISISCTRAVYGVPSPDQEASVDTWNGSWDAFPALLVSQLQVRLFAVLMPVLFLAFPEILGSLKQNALLLVVYAVLVTPLILLLALLPMPPCSGPGTPKKLYHRRRSSSLDSSIRGDASAALWTWVFWYGPVLLASILSATKMYRTRNMEAPMVPQIPAPPLPPAHEETGSWLDRRRG